MKLTFRPASVNDLDLLAEWNHQLIRDEGHRNPMNVAQLRERMKGWLEHDYRAVLFEENGPVAYAIYREERELVYLRQFFVVRERRRAGLGKAAMQLLREKIWQRDRRLTVDVMCCNPAGIAFWRSVGYQDYSLTLEIMPLKPERESGSN